MSTINKTNVLAAKSVGIHQHKRDLAVDRFPRTILDELGVHAINSGESIAFTFIEANESVSSLTYAALDQRARTIAAEMLRFAQPGDRALMMYSPSLAFIEAFIGCLYAGIIAVPAYPPKKNRSAERILAIARDCHPKLLLCNAETYPHVSGEFATAIPIARAIATDAIQFRGVTDFPELDSNQVAFLQYTSGSTATPKGVIVTHANIVANEQLIQQHFEHDKTSVVVSWMPMFHDMGLIGGVLQPLFVGFPSILMSPTTFLSDPSTWLQAITTYRGTSSGGPNFAYEHCLHNVSESQKRTLDLSSWKIAYNGSEPVRASTLECFSTGFRDCGFRRNAFFPCYGLAEATLFVSGGPPLRNACVANLDAISLESHQVRDVDHEDSSRVVANVSCGTVGNDLDVRVVNPITKHESADTMIGELWIHGSSIAAGYWGKDEESREAFHARLANDDRAWFRSGDYGFARNGEIHVTGRLKDLMIIRGRNLYPQDIEQLVARHLNFINANTCAAFSLQKDGDENVIVVAEGTREMARWKGDLSAEAASAQNELEKAVERLRSDVGDQFDVTLNEIVFVRPTTFPRTSSGKVQRHACRTGYQTETLNVIHVCSSIKSVHLLQPVAAMNLPTNVHSNAFESVVTQCKLLLAKELNLPVQRIDSCRSYASHGMDSIRMATFALTVQEMFSRPMSIDILQTYPTLNELGRYLADPVECQQ